MSTRSIIAKEYKGEIKGIYCHFDGYLSGVGATLKKFYTDDDTIDELIKLGGISILGEKLEVSQDLRSVKIDFEVMGEKNIFRAFVDEGTFSYLITDKDGKLLENPNGDKLAFESKLFDLRYQIDKVRENLLFYTMNNEVDAYMTLLKNELDKITIAYGRDRGESTVGIEVKDEDKLKKEAKDCWAEYVYLWRDGRWLVWELGEDEEFHQF